MSGQDLVTWSPLAVIMLKDAVFIQESHVHTYNLQILLLKYEGECILGEIYSSLCYIKNNNFGPGSCGSVDWVPACELKGCRFDSWSGHMPELRVRSLSGGM